MLLPTWATDTSPMITMTLVPKILRFVYFEPIILYHILSSHRLSFSFCKARESSVLLQQRHQEVYGHMDVLEKLLLTNLYVTHGGAEAEDLLHLKFDGGLALDVLF